MMTILFRPEAVLTLFLRMRTKGISKSLPIEELLPYYGKSRSVAKANGRIRYLTGSF